MKHMGREWRGFREIDRIPTDKNRGPYAGWHKRNAEPAMPGFSYICNRKLLVGFFLDASGMARSIERGIILATDEGRWQSLRPRSLNLS